MTRLSLLPALLLAALPASAQTFTGTLTDTDPVREGGARYDAYTFTLREGQQATVRMTTTDAFDTYLIVKGPRGEEHANDDAGSTSTSQVSFVASAAGTWTIWASAYSDDGRGSYTVEVTPGKVARVETTQGRLDPTDTQMPKGEYYDLVERRIDSPSPFSVELVGYGFDSFLVLQSPSGTFYRNDDDIDSGSGGNGNIQRSAVRDVPPEPGVWKIYVTTLGMDTFGAYDLRVLTFPN